jgi:glyoxylase-like metal-dependent hydrolase (beta-lactamase superfamily II)
MLHPRFFHPDQVGSGIALASYHIRAAWSGAAFFPAADIGVLSQPKIAAIERRGAAMNTECYRFRVGTFECMAVNDFTHTYAASRFFTNAPQQRLKQVLREHHLESEKIPSPFTCLFIDTGKNRILVDTGAGKGVHPQIGPYEGRLLRNLQSEGIKVEDIDTVILTHGHPDHIGGIVDESGRSVFNNARCVIWKDEWEFWTSEFTLETQPRDRVHIARERLLSIEDQLDLVDYETEIIPGIYAVEAKGHTPGHMAVEVSSCGEKLLYTSDTVLHQIHLEHPEWHTKFYDHDLEQAELTKRRIFDRAASDKALVLAFHFFPFPSLGYISKQGEGWQWCPIEVND